MKMRRIYSAFLFVLTLVFLVACVDDKKEMYTVTFDSNGGTTVESIELEEGSKIPEPTPAPQLAGHNFEGWFEGETKFNFETRVIEGNLALVAKWSNSDKIPPAFVGAINGVLPALEHLKGEEIDLEQGIRVRDETTKEEDVVLRVSDFGGYNKDVPGEYTIVFEAEDEAGNKSQAQRIVVVKDILVKEYNALVINGNNAEYEFNRSDALIFTSSGTNFRIFDIIQVMEKDVFVNQYNTVKDSHTNNGSIPFFPNGVILIVDEDMKVQHVRIAAGALIQINADGQLETEALTWTNGVDAVNGGGLFKGLIDELDTIIPDGGYLMFVGNTAPEVSRKFLIKNLFYSGYEGGAVALENFDVDVLELTIELKEVREEIAVPDKLPAPQLTLNEDLLSWEPIANAEKYEIYIDGELETTVTTSSISLNSLELDITETTPYKIEVVAVTSDIYSWSTSDKSEAIDYIQKEAIDAPVVSIDGSTLSWDAVTGAESYDIYISFAGQEVKLDNVEETTYDLSKVGIEFAGNVNVSVVAVSDENHYDSVKSDAVKAFIGKVETIVIDGYSVDVIKTTALNYFTRRNTNYGTDTTGFANSPYLYLITDIFEITKDDFAANATEAFSTVVLFDKDSNLKFANNIMAGQTYTVDLGWHKDDFYVNNNAQLANIKSHLAEGDMLLIGKNGNMVNVLLEDETVVENVNARHLIAHIFVKNNEDNNINGEAWRDDMSTFLDPKDITFEVVDRIIIEPKPEPEPEPEPDEKNIEYISINDEVLEVSFNWDEALKSTPAGTTFRSKDIIQVMDKTFFINSYNEHKDGHTNNGSIPFFPNGVILIVDEEMNVKHVRIAAGVLIQINADGQLETGTLTWTNGVDATNGGGLFKGLIDELDTIIPDGGYLMFVGNTAPEVSRKFLIKNLFYSGYEGGAVALENFDVDVLELTIEFLGSEEVSSPISAPTVTNEGTLLKWDEVEFATSYEVYINYASKDILISETTDLEYDFAEDIIGLEGYNNFYVIAIGDDNMHLNSEKSTMLSLFNGEVETFVIDGYKTVVIKTNALNYFTRRNTSYGTDKTGFANSPYLYLITDIFEITKDDFAVNATEAFSTIVLLDENGAPKLINNILAKQSWNKTDGWNADANYAANSAQLANLSEHLLEGDMLLIGKNGNNLEVETPDGTIHDSINARNFLAFFYVNENGEAGIEATTGEGWRAGLDNFIDPTDVTFEILGE